jgi:hypothetical protein
MFGVIVIVVAVAVGIVFQKNFRAKMYVNNIFLFLKNYF